MAALKGGWVVSRTSVGMMMRHPELGCSLSDHFAIEATLTFHPLPDSNGSPAGQHLTQPRFPSSVTTAVPRADSEILVDGALANKDRDVDTRTLSTHIPTLALQNGTFLHIQTQSPAPSVDYTHSPSTTKRFDAQLLSLANPEEPTALPSSAYDEILAIIQKYERRERSQLKWRARHFFASIAVTVACLIGVWFNPYSHVSFVLILVSSLGLVAGTVDGLLALLFFKSELGALKEFQWEVMNAKASIGGGVEPAREDLEGDERAW